MAGTRSEEVRRVAHELKALRHDGDVATDPELRDLTDVSALLARLVDERIPLALIADLANPDGPDSDWIMVTEALDVG